jgi:PPK2 family polyphosphate:nucleotide phosphotransferase
MRLTTDQLKDLLMVSPGKKLKLRDHDPAWLGSRQAKLLEKDELKEESAAFLENNRKALAAAQALLYASQTHAVLIVLQAMDAGGKDGTIRHVMSGVNPQGCTVSSFKAPSAEELSHTWLWRYQKRVPERGRIGIFNRSHYEDVLVVKVHPELLEKQYPKKKLKKQSFWEERYEDINAFERHLARNGVVILKFFLNVSREEQKRRFLRRLEDPDRNWKFSPSDIAERAHWDRYQKAFEEALSATSTKWAPWYVIPADHKFVTRALVAHLVTHAIEELDLHYPKVSGEQKSRIEAAREQLQIED